MHTSQRHHGAEYIELSAGTADHHHHHSTDLDDVDDPPDDPSSNERQAMLPPTKRRYSDVESQPLASLNDSRRLSSSSTPFLVDSDPVINNDKDSIIETGYTSTMAREALPSLIISVIGLIVAGVLMDKFQGWDVFTKTPELFILVPILLNLKGNLEMNLAARFSTAANLGELDHGPTRRSLVIGNLALLQVQALVSGAIAGLASFALGLVTKPGGNASTYFECMYMTSSAMISAAASSAILGVFMCGLIILCRHLRVNPDNIACPMASSTGDIVTLVLLAGCAVGLQEKMHSLLSTFLFLTMVALLPLFGIIVWKNVHVKELLFGGWTPILVAMVISSLAGVVLEKYVEEYKGVALLTPVLIGLAGNLGSIYASRISTCLHCETKEDYKLVEFTLLIMNIPVQVVFLIIIWAFHMGQLNYNFWFCLAYFCVSMICTWISLKSGKIMTLAFWKRGYDPDTYVLPYLTAGIDVVGTGLLVLAFAFLTVSGANDMSQQVAGQSQ
ncbi:solute carrier family 41 member 1 [Lichtheimia corymbifera JMRC:FSU:9682]|uniref:Solute carrier family 41 member 1 n=1 Tax=Lichtheimia corymbifera JMRC:FSU:9682 TaxID=1263082 RepID=A0A068RPW3_9FUNG|nr:solute carrier family 41 member 1 [Lichtheimia corymbifera JMRC:FSU:9682]